MDTTSPAVAPAASVTAALPSSTFSVSLVNAVLGMFLECAASIEEIANENNLSIPVVMQCLEEQKPFLRNMLSTLELRVRMLAARAEAAAIESLREIAIFARDQEARRKAASKLLSHFAKFKAPSPRRAGRSVIDEVDDDEGSSRIAQDQQPVSQPTPAASPEPHAPAAGEGSQPVGLGRTPGASPGPHTLKHSNMATDAVAPPPDATLLTPRPRQPDPRKKSCGTSELPVPQEEREISRTIQRSDHVVGCAGVAGTVGVVSRAIVGPGPIIR